MLQWVHGPITVVIGTERFTPFSTIRREASRIDGFHFLLRVCRRSKNREFSCENRELSKNNLSNGAVNSKWPNFETENQLVCSFLAVEAIPCSGREESLNLAEALTSSGRLLPPAWV